MTSVTIKIHPSVVSCEAGAVTGSEHKYDVMLKAGWHFSALNEGNPHDLRTWSGFDTVAEFLDAEPRLISSEGFSEPGQ